MTTTNFVEWHIGTSPLLITCPHDGRQQPPGTPERPDRQPGCGRARKQADLSTRLIALGLSQAVLGSTRTEPSIVIARFHRRFIDANRPAQCAFQSRVAAPFYREYHSRIDLAVAAIKAQFPKRGVLVDIHGAADLADQPDVHVLLGSDNGNSIRRLLNLDELILFRRAGLVRTLQAARFGVIPAEFDEPEHASFDGGFTVREHGASQASGLDALQIEIVRSVRGQEQRRNQLIQSLGHGLVRLLAQQARLVQQRG
jgi:N-formylglutamate amidohydrolase